MNIDDKKKLGIIVFAVGVGLAASVLTGQYINKDVNEKAEQRMKQYEKRVEKKMLLPLKQEIANLKKEVKKAQTQQPKTIVRGPAKPAMGTGALAMKTPPGKRAMTLSVDSLAAVGGLVNPGDFVDILAHLNVPNRKGKVIAMIFQNIQILAIGTKLRAAGVSEAQHKAASLKITFAVDPDEVGLLSFAQQHGVLNLALRAPKETQTNMVKEANWMTFSDYVLETQGIDITAGAKRKTKRKTPEARPVMPNVEIYKGGRKL